MSKNHKKPRDTLPRPARAGLFLVEVIEQFAKNDCPQLAAALTYYAIFSLPPLLVLLSASLGFFIDADSARQVIHGSTAALLSPRMAQNVIELIRDANNFTGEGPWWSLSVSVLGIAFGASRGFVQLQRALNRAWGIRPSKEKSAVRVFLSKRLVAFLMLAATLPTIALSTLIGSLFLRFEQELRVHLPELFMTFVSHGFGSAVSVLVTVAVCTTVYRFVPDAKISWRQAFPGAVMAGLAFEALKYLMGLYLAHLELNDVFGQASSLAAVLIWLYVSSNVLFLGAEFAQVWSSHQGSPVEPDQGAERDPQALELELTPELRKLAAKKFATPTSMLH